MLVFVTLYACFLCTKLFSSRLHEWIAILNLSSLIWTCPDFISICFVVLEEIHLWYYNTTSYAHTIYSDALLFDTFSLCKMFYINEDVLYYFDVKLTVMNNFLCKISFMRCSFLVTVNSNCANKTNTRSWLLQLQHIFRKP